MISYSILFDGRSLIFARSVSLIDKLSLIWLYCDETGDFTVINPPWCSSWLPSNTSWTGALLVESRRWDYIDVIMTTMASQITSLTFVYSTVYSDADQRKHQSSASLAFVWGIHRGPVNSPHKGPVTRKRFSFDDVIMLGSPCPNHPCHTAFQAWNIQCIMYQIQLRVADKIVKFITISSFDFELSFGKMLIFEVHLTLYRLYIR